MLGIRIPLVVICIEFLTLTWYVKHAGLQSSRHFHRMWYTVYLMRNMAKTNYW